MLFTVVQCSTVTERLGRVAIGFTLKKQYVSGGAHTCSPFFLNYKIRRSCEDVTP